MNIYYNSEVDEASEEKQTQQNVDKKPNVTDILENSRCFYGTVRELWEVGT